MVVGSLAIQLVVIHRNRPVASPSSVPRTGIAQNLFHRRKAESQALMQARWTYVCQWIILQLFIWYVEYITGFTPLASCLQGSGAVHNWNGGKDEPVLI